MYVPEQLHAAFLYNVLRFLSTNSNLGIFYPLNTRIVSLGTHSDVDFGGVQRNETDDDVNCDHGQQRRGNMEGFSLVVPSSAE